MPYIELSRYLDICVVLKLKHSLKWCSKKQWFIDDPLAKIPTGQWDSKHSNANWLYQISLSKEHCDYAFIIRYLYFTKLHHLQYYHSSLFSWKKASVKKWIFVVISQAILTLLTNREDMHYANRIQKISQHITCMANSSGRHYLIRYYMARYA